MSHADEIREAIRDRALEKIQASTHYTRIMSNIAEDAQSPLEHAAQTAEMAIADLHVMISRAQTASELAEIQIIVNGLWLLMDGCERAARRKAEAL